MNDADSTSETIEVHRDVSSAGVRLRCTEWRTLDDGLDKPAITALPGVLSPRYSFAEVARSLADEFRVFAVDLPGFGESEKHSPTRYNYSIPSFMEAIADLFGGLSIPQAHVLGHGVGGKRHRDQKRRTEQARFFHP